MHRHRDVEHGYTGSFGSDETAVSAVKEEEELKQGMISKGGYMDLVSNVWHWHAVEWGGRCKLSFWFWSCKFRDLYLFSTLRLYSILYQPLDIHQFMGLRKIFKSGISRLYISPQFFSSRSWADPHSYVHRLQFTTPGTASAGVG